MKAKGNIYPKICEIENIKKAMIYASRQKRDRNDVKGIYNNIDYYCNSLGFNVTDRRFTKKRYVRILLCIY